MWTKKELAEIKKTNEKVIEELIITIDKIKKKKGAEIAKLNELIEDLRRDIDRQNKLLTEHDLYEKKAKENAPTGVPAIDATMDRLIRLEAKFEAQENPYFF